MSILIGDARDKLRELPDASVHCCITSPPYFGLRDYGTAQWEGGAPVVCEHEGKAGTRHEPGRDPIAVTICHKCGAFKRDRQIGLESTLREYIATLVDVFREVRRVLRDDGTVWLNLGDSYGSGEIGRHDGYNPTRANGTTSHKDFGERRQRPRHGLKPKDLMMVPARVAIALQDDGWYLRSDIIWAKPNPMPESVTDRPTGAHEHVFLLSKSPRYYYDGDAIREPHVDSNESRADALAAHGTSTGPEVKKIASGKERSNGWHYSGLPGAGMNFGGYNPAGRNKRNVWTIATTPYPGAHFATFPPKLVEPMILAGTSEKGCCPACGSPWVRVVERESEYEGKASTPYLAESHAMKHAAMVDGNSRLPSTRTTTIGWSPSCPCPAADPVPCTVLDPFLGAGTTLLVADRLGRNGIGIELNPTYAALARKRLYDDAPLFASLSPTLAEQAAD